MATFFFIFFSFSLRPVVAGPPVDSHDLLRLDPFDRFGRFERFDRFPGQDVAPLGCKHGVRKGHRNPDDVLEVSGF